MAARAPTTIAVVDTANPAATPDEVARLDQQLRADGTGDTTLTLSSGERPRSGAPRSSECGNVSADCSPSVVTRRVI